MKTKPQPDDIDKHVGQRVRERRTELSLSMEKLADKIGITYQQIQKYETGLNRVSAGRLWQLSKALDVSVLYFFPGYQEHSSAFDSGKITLYGGVEND